MKVKEYLEKSSAHYEELEHRPTFTSQHMAAEEHVPGLCVAKPVLVKADEKFYLCVLPGCYKIDLDELRGQLGASNVSLADESEIAKVFADCELGAEPPFGELYGIDTIMDESLEDDEFVVFQGGSHEKAIKMTIEEYLMLAKPVVLNFSYPMR